MANLTVKEAGVQAGEQALVRGLVNFSALTDKRSFDAPGTQYPQGPQFGITLSNPEVIKRNNSPLERFLEAHIFFSPKAREKRITITSKGDYAPRAFDQTVRRAGGFQLKGELAQGQEVIALVGAYKPKNWSNIGVGLQGIMVPDENKVQYFHSASGGITIEAFGVQADPNAPQAPAQTAQSAPAASQSQTAPVAPQSAPAASAAAAGASPAAGFNPSFNPFASQSAPAASDAPNAFGRKTQTPQNGSGFDSNPAVGGNPFV